MPSFFSPPVFVASLNPADLCLNLLMAVTDSAPNNLIGGNGVNPPLQEVSLEELLNLLLGCPGPAPTSAVPAGGRWGTLGSHCHLLAVNHS